jgi:lysozyme
VTPAEQIAVGLEQRFEGFESIPYLCPAGVPTVGFGFTHYPDGRRVALTDPPMTLEAARAMLLYFTRHEYMPAAMALCPGAATPGQIGALTDICFNIGKGNLRASTLRRKVNAGEWDEVPAQFRRWTKAGGRILRGLVLRREAEIAHL